MNALPQATSYCAGAPAPCRALEPYAWLPLPPLTLLTPGSLNTEPGDVAALPGELVAPEPPHSTPWSVSAYAGAAPPMIATATMQLAQDSLCLMSALLSGR